MEKDTVYPIVRNERDGRVIAAGLTKRELFAAMAMQGLCGNGAVAGAASRGWARNNDAEIQCSTK